MIRLRFGGYVSRVRIAVFYKRVGRPDHIIHFELHIDVKKWKDPIPNQMGVDVYTLIRYGG